MAAEVMVAVLEQVRNALDPVPPSAFVVPGADVAWDDACGQLWVRLVTATPRYARGSSCPYGLVLTLGIGVIRCVATLNDQGVPPSPAQVTADGQRTTGDAEAIYRALACFTPPKAARSALTTWTPLGPQGASAGGEWQMEVTLT